VATPSYQLTTQQYLEIHPRPLSGLHVHHVGDYLSRSAASPHLTDQEQSTDRDINVLETEGEGHERAAGELRSSMANGLIGATHAQNWKI
jgi:hypothetical protein